MPITDNDKLHRPDLHGRNYGERLTRIEKALDALTGRAPGDSKNAYLTIEGSAPSPSL
jgi:hypothetical protein